MYSQLTNSSPVTSEICRKSFNQKTDQMEMWIYAKNLRALGPINVNNKTDLFI